MGNVRVFQLARDLNLPSQEVIDRLKKLGEKLFVSQRVLEEDLFSGIVQLDSKAKRREFF